MDQTQIEQRLTSVLQNAECWLPAEQLTDMKVLVEAGEPGVALENFCMQLEEFDVVVPLGMARELREIAAAMGMKVSAWVDRSAGA